MMNVLNYCCRQKKGNKKADLDGNQTKLSDTINNMPKKSETSEIKLTRPKQAEPETMNVSNENTNSSSLEPQLANIKLTMLSSANYQSADSIHHEMFMAVLKRDKQSLKRLMEMESNRHSWNGIYQFVNSSKREVTPMELACTLGFVDIISMFLDNGCSPNLPTSSGRLIHTILESLKSSKIALQDGRTLIKRLCKEGCNVNIIGEYHKTPILLAAELGDADILKTLLSVADTAVVLKIGDVPNGFTPLHMSAMRGDLDCVLVLLKYCDPTVVNILEAEHSNSALLLAIKSMHRNLNYMNSIVKESQLTDKNNVGSEQMQKLRQFQCNSVAIAESLLLHGADVTCTVADSNMGNNLLYQALSLVRDDQTCEKFNKEQYSETMQLITCTKLEHLNTVLTSNENDSLQSSDNDIPTSEYSKSSEASQYEGIVRLLVLYGLKPGASKETWLSETPKNSRLYDLIEEIFFFWENNARLMDGPQKLMHLCKQVIRSSLADSQNLHMVDSLPLPTTVLSFLKLQCL